MSRAILFLLFLGFSLDLVAQKVSNVDLDRIEEEVNNTDSEYYYADLKERLAQLDTTLSQKEYKHLYFGQTLYEGDTSSSTDLPADVDSFSIHMKSEAYEKAIPLGRRKFLQDPVNLDILYKMMICYYETGQKDSSKLFAQPYYSFLNVIYRSGNGYSPDSAFVVNEVSDEYHVIGDQRLRFKGQSLIQPESGPTDVMKVYRPQKDGSKADTMKMYFNVTIPFKGYNEMLKENGKDE